MGLTARRLTVIVSLGWTLWAFGATSSTAQAQTPPRTPVVVSVDDAPHVQPREPSMVGAPADTARIGADELRQRREMVAGRLGRAGRASRRLHRGLVGVQEQFVDHPTEPISSATLDGYRRDIGRLRHNLAAIRTGFDRLGRPAEATRAGQLIDLLAVLQARLAPLGLEIVERGDQARTANGLEFNLALLADYQRWFVGVERRLSGTPGNDFGQPVDDARDTLDRTPVVEPPDTFAPTRRIIRPPAGVRPTRRIIRPPAGVKPTRRIIRPAAGVRPTRRIIRPPAGVKPTRRIIRPPRSPRPDTQIIRPASSQNPATNGR